MGKLRGTLAIIRQAAYDWFNDGAMSMAASIAFYTAFSLAPIFLLVTAIAGIVFGAEAAQGALAEQLQRLLGREPAEAIQAVVKDAGDTQSGTLASVIGLVTILVGATTVFTELQASLNRIWRAEAPAESTLTWLVRVRLKGLALIGVIGFLLIVSLVVSAAIAAMGAWFAQYFSGLAALLAVGNLVLSLVVFTLLFALVYRVLPDTRIPWRDLWLGAAVTALLFQVGKGLIALYIAKAGIASAYGAAGSLALLLLWVYYSASIFLFGAEITRCFAERVGSRSGKPGTAVASG